MTPNPTLWTQLEACGVTEAHLEALVRFFRLQENGMFQWHAHQGRFHHCELRVSFSAQAAQVARVSAVVLDHENAP